MKDLEEAGKKVALLEKELRRKTSELAKTKKRERELLYSERLLALRNRISELVLIGNDANVYEKILDEIFERVECRFLSLGRSVREDRFTYCEKWENEKATEENFDNGEIPEARSIEALRRLAASEGKTSAAEGPVQYFRLGIFFDNALCAPVVHEEKTVGVLCSAGFKKKNDGQNRKLLEDVAAQMGPAVALMREKELEKREKLRSRQARKRFRTQLEQARRMETFGSMAGGMANDFNNILNVIIGNAILAMDDISEKHRARDYLEEIRLACDRAGEIVKQFRLFGKKEADGNPASELVADIQEPLPTFPRKPEAGTENVADANAIPSGNERILFIDDEASMVKMAKKILARLGYDVIDFTNPLMALHAFKEKPDLFDLAITDLCMPELSGDKLAQELLKIRPDFPIILTTGFSERISERQGALLGIKKYMEKPFDRAALALAVRNVLDNL